MGDDSELKDEGVSQKTEQELVKLYKRRLENWREILTHLNALLTWEKPYFPGIIAGVVTFIFIMLWYFDPSVLTTLSIVGIIACVLDYVVPILSASFFDSSKWTGARERKYEEICGSLVSCYIFLKSIWDSARQIKESKPYVYFVAVLGTLVTTAWIGNWINNLFLTYLIVLFVSLLPGVKSQSLVQQYSSQLMAMIKGVTGQTKKKK
ncbi:ADP-ribosylation factor-like protein 6-interacting protein 1 [Uloborus diversus]|uniref:ADP-ribosylation factor-like protein 6-interacting protein 1 n=1 Tax=Uloborus diversus TaxID=327109 RepID=UPI0024090D10|nr:ADP-ribosylation factor-like protein 6-interacting protein 1 [Uloborus diversus]